MNNKKNKKPNMTTLVVRDAMKSVAKDIRKPKVVRDGLVKPQLNKINPIEYIVLNHDLTFKKKHLLSTPRFASEAKTVDIPSREPGFVPQKVTSHYLMQTVEVKFVPKKKKFQKLKELLENTKPIDMLAVYKNGQQILANGFFVNLNADSFTGDYSFTFMPNYFTVI